MSFAPFPARSPSTRPMLRTCRIGIVCAAMGIVSVASTPSAADIWGFVDEFGIAHFSNHQLNDRYKLIQNDAPRPDMETVPPPATTRPAVRTGARGTIIAISPAQRARYAPLIESVAQEFNLDVSLLHAIVAVESGYNPQARSRAGAVGLMQLVPETAQRFRVRNIHDPLENLRGGARYLRFLLDMFNNNLALALAAYNAGENAVTQAGYRIPNYPETRAYVPSVLAHYRHYANGNGGAVPLETTPIFDRVVEPLVR